MKAGRELDALVDDVVMGIVGTRWKFDSKGEPVELPVPHYSTSISDAHILIERLRDIYEESEITIHVTEKGWSCYVFIAPDELGIVGEAETAPLAICLAALKVVEGDKS